MFERRELTPSSAKSGSANTAWWAVLIGALALSAAALLAGGESNPYPRVAARIAGAAQTTLALVASGALVASVLGVLIGVLRVSRHWFRQFLGSVYVEIFRGIPLYVLLLFVYFGLNNTLKFDLDGIEVDLRLGPFWSAVAAIGLCYGAFIGEVVRAGIQAIPPEEIEAASLEGTRLQVFGYVVLPQATRLILPAWANEVIALMKDTSLVAAVALRDITFAGREFGLSTGLLFESFAAVALVYLIATLLLSRLARWMESAWSADRVMNSPAG